MSYYRAFGYVPAGGGASLPVLPANVAVETNADGTLTGSVITVTELDYLQGASSNIQTQISNSTTEMTGISGSLTALSSEVTGISGSLTTLSSVVTGIAGYTTIIDTSTASSLLVRPAGNGQSFRVFNQAGTPVMIVNTSTQAMTLAIPQIIQPQTGEDGTMWSILNANGQTIASVNTSTSQFLLPQYLSSYALSTGNSLGCMWNNYVANGDNVNFSYNYYCNGAGSIVIPYATYNTMNIQLNSFGMVFQASSTAGQPPADVLTIQAGILIPADSGVSLGSTADKFTAVYSATTSTGTLSPLTGSSISLTGSLVPTTANSLNLGSSADYMAEVYTGTAAVTTLSPLTGSSISLTGSLVPTTANSLNLGSSADYMAEVYTGTAAIGTLSPLTGSSITLESSLVPNTPGAWNLGSNSDTINNIYTGNLYTNSLNVSSGTQISLGMSLIPTVNASWNLGSSSYAFNGAFFDTVSVDVLKGLGTTIDVITPLVTDNVYPVESNSYTCGTSSYLWSAVYATNGTIQTSDATVKKNIQPLDMGLNWVKKLKPVSWDWADSIASKHSTLQKNNCGFLAGDIKENLGGVNHSMYHPPETEGGHEGLNYSQFIGPMVKAIQELSAQVASLQNQVNVLSAKI